MPKPVRLEDEAEAEVSAALAYYEAEVEGLGWDLLGEVDRALRRLSESPQAYGLAPSVEPSLNVRRALLRRFPFAVVYLEHEDVIRVLALAHLSRRPGYWRDRLP